MLKFIYFSTFFILYFVLKIDKKINVTNHFFELLDEIFDLIKKDIDDILFKTNRKFEYLSFLNNRNLLTEDYLKEFIKTIDQMDKLLYFYQSISCMKYKIDQNRLISLKNWLMIYNYHQKYKKLRMISLKLSIKYFSVMNQKIFNYDKY